MDTDGYRELRVITCETPLRPAILLLIQLSFVVCAHISFTSVCHSLFIFNVLFVLLSGEFNVALRFSCVF